MFYDGKCSGEKYSRVRGIGSGGVFINLIRVVMVKVTEQRTFE